MPFMSASPALPSDLLARVKTGVPLAGALILLLIYLPPFGIGLLVVAIALLGVWEYSGMLSGTSSPVPFIALAGAVVLMSAGTLFAGRDGLTAALFACLLLWIGWSLLSQSVKSLEAMAGFGVGVLGLLWIVWSLQHFTLIASRPSGIPELFFVLLVVSFELMGIPLYVLAALHKESKHGVEGATKLFLTGALSSAILLYGLSFVVGAGGSTLLSDLGAVESSPMLAFGLFLALGITSSISFYIFFNFASKIYNYTLTAFI